MSPALAIARVYGSNSLFEKRSMKHFRNAAGIRPGLFDDAKAYASKISMNFLEDPFRNVSRNDKWTLWLYNSK